MTLTLQGLGKFAQMAGRRPAVPSRPAPENSGRRLSRPTPHPHRLDGAGGRTLRAVGGTNGCIRATLAPLG